jgi:hypothetical protein
MRLRNDFCAGAGPVLPAAFMRLSAQGLNRDLDRPIFPPSLSGWADLAEPIYASAYDRGIVRRGIGPTTEKTV